MGGGELVDSLQDDLSQDDEHQEPSNFQVPVLLLGPPSWSLLKCR